ncbi:MAG: bifunctional riboflavin kinase/FAD synthetase [Candidatus Adiutrix sp.]|jgi:riboflavin kinase/FMN adenylyltransferase|nr:bifunctional riboflavin kinase/FAD synthetase [Candidatus Adiutrix sp.]
MELISNWAEQNASLRPRAAFSIGVFDGLHLGHRALIDTVIKNAARLKAQSLILTFEPHPLQILAPAAAPPVLTTLEQKAEILEAWGLDRLGVLRFTREMAAVEAQKFLYQFLGKFIEPAAAVLGPDFNFGKDAKGDAASIEEWLNQSNPKARLSIVEAIAGQNGLFASSQIRQDLKSGLVESASRSLDRPYRLLGVVKHGQARGRTMGFPTANLGCIRQLIPDAGVYAVRVNLEEQVYAGMTSIGYNPTFGEQPMTVETHIFDFERFIYGQRLSIDFIARLRSMIRFESPEQLASQLDKDRANARKALEQS